MSKVTINDIARESHVSVGTVYRAVNNSGRISQETRKRVLETVERLGYKANSIARGLALRSKFNILVIMPRTPEFFWNDVMKGTRRAAAELSEFGVQVIEFFHKDGISDGKSIMEVIAEQNIDAIAMSIVSFNDCGNVLLYASDKKIPIAIYNDDTVSRDRLFFYGPDNCLAGQMAAELMYKFSGRNGICCTISRADFGAENAAGIDREKSFQDYLAQQCTDMQFIKTYRCALGETPLVIRQILKDYPEMTGLYFTDFGQLINNFKFFSEFKKKYVIIGHEYSEEYRDALRDGTITALLSEEKICQGYYPITILYQYLMTGEKPARDSFYSNINIIISTNADCLNYSNYGCGYE
ncbi:MAG: LacI family DNA-binding transcriptional regulator [Clostridiaceae bacterium]|nr:LacI family DNA-binding transcriptional regulator [Clostridiaceae bacterium]